MATLKSRLQALLHEVGDAGGGTMLEDAKRVAEAVGLEFRNVKTLVEEAEQNLFGESRDAEQCSPHPAPEPQHFFPPMPPRTRAYPSEAPPPAEDDGSAAEGDAAPLEDDGALTEGEGAPAEDEEWLPPDDEDAAQEWLPPEATDGLDAEHGQLPRDAGSRAVPSRGPSPARKRPLEADPSGRVRPSRRSEDRRAPRERKGKEREKGKDKGTDKGRDRGKPGKGKGDQEMRPGDWKCESCGFHNFAKNDACKQCGKSNKAKKANRAMREFRANGSCKRFCIMWMMGSCKNSKKCTFAHAPHELASARDLRRGSWLCEKCGRVLASTDRGCSNCHFAPTRNTLVYDERRGDFSRLSL